MAFLKRCEGNVEVTQCCVCEDNACCEVEGNWYCDKCLSKLSNTTSTEQ